MDDEDDEDAEEGREAVVTKGYLVMSVMLLVFRAPTPAHRVALRTTAALGSCSSSL